MCYAIPGKLVEIKENIGVIDYFGELRHVLIDTDVIVGDYVYAQGGVLIAKVDQKEALETLDFWKEKFFELKKVDKKLSKVREKKASNHILEILQKVNLGQDISKEEMLTLYETHNSHEIKLICQMANNIRQKDHDNACCVHGIIEFSNYCKNTCTYCGIRNFRSIQRYRMSEEQILETAKYAVEKLGFKALVLQSGEDYWYTQEKLIRIVSLIRKLNVLIFLSIGIRSASEYSELYKAGARAVLLRFETSNKKIFSQLRPGTDFDERINLIRELKNMNYLIATGFICGLPGETSVDAINNMLLTKELGADMYSFGPLIPTQDAPADQIKPTKDSILKTIAITRLIDRKSKILVTTALETLDPQAKKQGLMAGANSLMINATPSEFKKNYCIYPGRPDVEKDVQNNIKQTTDLLYSIGRAPTDIGL